MAKGYAWYKKEHEDGGGAVLMTVLVFMLVSSGTLVDLRSEL